eukprot:CAMPEP_0178454388 /NCGR_PEP_ID=MMETSP0689_2-20121128/45332_1 /TAXON_ID=160604 /ORGANISM="Amphidinium massartii, Strain CS-259" /LENGTH=75 /DNA_ID=CAMNT_0020080319 /DNA_START=18 /DNA_END=245 /DNA_ORIENTATION=+
MAVAAPNDLVQSYPLCNISRAAAPRLRPAEVSTSFPACFEPSITSSAKARALILKRLSHSPTPSATPNDPHSASM